MNLPKELKELEICSQTKIQEITIPPKVKSASFQISWCQNNFPEKILATIFTARNASLPLGRVQLYDLETTTSLPAVIAKIRENVNSR